MTYYLPESRSPILIPPPNSRNPKHYFSDRQAIAEAIEPRKLSGNHRPANALYSAGPTTERPATSTSQVKKVIIVGTIKCGIPDVEWYYLACKVRSRKAS
ncbi:hypothetical protein R6Q59_007153 [Mikania micrantha]